jgi:catechol 2,3-dioxygenase-like lactoylglutathione lyase family enzyme
MTIKVLEIHHTGVRIDVQGAMLGAAEQFYAGVLGLAADRGRPTSPGIPGARMNVGEVGQIHLIGGDQPSRVTKGPGEDPARPHVALAVADIVATRAELDHMGVKYGIIEGLTGPDAVQVFLNDPCGNMIELHQVDRCRCRASNRAPA